MNFNKLKNNIEYKLKFYEVLKTLKNVIYLTSAGFPLTSIDDLALYKNTNSTEKNMYYLYVGTFQKSMYFLPVRYNKIHNSPYAFTLFNPIKQEKNVIYCSNNLLRTNDCLNFKLEQVEANYCRLYRNLVDAN